MGFYVHGFFRTPLRRYSESGKLRLKIEVLTQELMTQLICMCWICGRPVSTERTKCDEYGTLVHEHCHAVKTALANEWIKLDKMASQSATDPKSVEVATTIE